MFLNSKSSSEYRLKRAFLSLMTHLKSDKPICDEDKKILSYFCSIIISKEIGKEQIIDKKDLDLIESLDIKYVQDKTKEDENSFQHYSDDKLQIYLLKKSKIKTTRIVDIVPSASEVERTLRRICERLDKRFTDGGYWYRIEKLDALQSAYASLIKTKLLREEEHIKIVEYLVSLKLLTEGEINASSYKGDLKTMRSNLENMEEVLLRLLDEDSL